LTAAWGAALDQLSERTRAQFRRNEPLNRHTTLRVGGPADLFLYASDRDTLAEVVMLGQRLGLPMLLLGDGSNVCIGDSGVRGLTIRNGCRAVEVGPMTRAECGCGFMRLFMLTMRAGLSGLEFAVGIPGTVGGALVSNAGAYRANICDLVRRIEVVEDGERKWVGPDWMEFSYRDSRLRREDGKPGALLAVDLELTQGVKREIRLKARDIQLQRILKQPWEPSAGSWFKNVLDRDLAADLSTLPRAMKEAGVVPAGYLTEACGLKGFTIGGAMIAPRHANFIVNRGMATAADLRAVAELARQRVLDKFGVCLEAEVMCIGD
jgi:UDP-N-acetylmuramate dehydrogenase